MRIETNERTYDRDVIVIGGGVNGTGVARDLSLRGLKVALFERNDISFGASGNSSGMIHGGPRYLTHDPDVTHSSCLDSGHIQRIAPHLLFRIPFLMPVHRERPNARIALTLLDAFFEAYDRYQPLKHGKPHTRLSAEDLRTLEPGLTANTVGGVSFDEWGIDGSRLCIASAVDAIEHGASVCVHTEVTEILRHPDGAVRGVRIRDRITGARAELTAPVVVNATGAWAPLTASLGGLPAERARVRPGKGIHIFFERRLLNYALIANAIDGRMVFVQPWQNMTVVGTTDDDYYGDLDNVIATTDEVRYLLEAVADIFPAIRSARAIGTWAGVRPTLYEWGRNEDELSREHQIVDHTEHGAPGLFSMLGGKLASYRLFSEELSDVVAGRLGVKARSTTHQKPLPGGEIQIDPLQLADQVKMEPMAATRLEYRHGARALRIAERIKNNPKEATIVCVCEPVTEAEVRYVVEHELVRTVGDVARRTRLGLGTCGGMRCAARCGQIVAEMTGRSPLEGQRMALQFASFAQARRVAAVGPAQARQEALTTASLRSQVGAVQGLGQELEEG
ncbi:MAG TPA: glycerol-3-phosphate dehydrogenase/oxidase [Polyangiaceae bacterium]|nr:glycerol-3-phosphate dehydrogenase/oxidase [Polyangiaceae bacterium]